MLSVEDVGCSGEYVLSKEIFFVCVGGASSSSGITFRLAKNVADRIKNFFLEKVSIWCLPPLFKEWDRGRLSLVFCLLSSSPRST